MKVAQLGFTGGEFSYPMYGRPDDSAYTSGLGRAENFLIRPQGTIRSRPGFEFVTEAKYGDRKCRLIPFQFSSADTAVIEMGHQYMRFMVDGAVVLGEDGQPYEIETPYQEADLFQIHYDQSADVMTFAHTSYSPKTLKRYGPDDWRLEDVDLTMKLSPPENVQASSFYPDQDGDSDGSFGYKEEDKDRVTSTYCVTTVDEDGNESERSDTATCKGNYYITGAYNLVSWDTVEGANRYKVYRESGGIYGFIGETSSTSIKDDNISADTTKTPPAYAKFFSATGGIKSVTVTNGGSGYVEDTPYYPIPTPFRIPDFGGFAVYRNNALYNGDTGAPTFPQTVTAIATLSEDDEGFPRTANLTLTLQQSVDGQGGYYYITDFTEESGFYFLSVTLSESTHRYTSPIMKISTPDLGLGNEWKLVREVRQNVTPSDPARDEYLTSAKTELDALFKNGAELTTFPQYTGQVITQNSSGKVPLEIEDATGYGASLTAVVKDGVITAVLVDASGLNYTAPTITAIGSGSGATFSVELFTADDIQAPGALGLFEQRRWFAGTNERPLGIFATKSGTTDEMSRHYPTQNVDDCIVVQAETRDANRILHLVPLQDLVMFTGTAEWRISASDGGAITPTNISVKPQSYYGSTEVQPVIASNQCLYCTARGGHIREMGYSRDVYGYLSSDISVRATHLFDSYKIDDMCYMKAPFPRLVCVSSGGFIANCTYMPEQSLRAWSRFTTDGTFESCASIPEGGDDGEDSLYVVVRRIVQGQEVRYVERMGVIEDNSVMALGLDSCLSGVFETPQSTVAGLNHLEGKTVCAQCDGQAVYDLVVKDGQVSLPFPALQIVVGLQVDYLVKTLPFITQMQGYGKGRIKNVGKIYLQIIHEGALEVGPTNGQMVKVNTSFLNRYSDEPSEPELREVSCVVRGKWDELGQMLIHHTDFKPIEITSWAADVEVGA